MKGVEMLRREKGSAMLVALVFTVIFLMLLAILFGVYLFEVKMYAKMLNRYRSELMVRDMSAVIQANQNLSIVNNDDEYFVTKLAEYSKNDDIVISTDKWLSCYPMPTDLKEYFPEGVLYLYAYWEKEIPVIDSLAVVSGGGYDSDTLIDKIKEERAENADSFPLVGELSDRKTFAQYKLYNKGLYNLGNTANITGDYGPYARLSGDIVFRNRAGRNYIIFLGLYPLSGTSWQVKDTEGNVISSGSDRTLMDTLVKGNFYFGGDDIRVVDDSENYAYSTSNQKTLSLSDHFAVVSGEDFKTETEAKANADYLYYYDPAKDSWKTVLINSPIKSEDTVYNIYYDVVFRGAIETKSDYAIEITDYLFGNTSVDEGAPSDPWERLVTSSIFWKSAYYRAHKDEKVFEISGDNDYLITFYVDNNEHTHILYAQGSWDWFDGLEITGAYVYDADLTMLYGNKVLVYFSEASNVYVIPPCAMTNDDTPVWNVRYFDGNPVCQAKKVGGKTVYEVNSNINPQARDTSLNPNWNYDWTHYVYPLTPSDWKSIRDDEGWDKILAKPYHANWQNMNMYSMKVTLAVSGNIYVFSNIVFLPDGPGPSGTCQPGKICYFEQDFAKDLKLDFDIPSAVHYPSGKVMAMYAKNDIVFGTYSCSQGDFYSNRDKLACRGATMYGFRFPKDTVNKIPSSFDNYDDIDDNMKLHAWDMLFYSYAISVEGSWYQIEVWGDFPYTEENFKKIGTLAQAQNKGGMICSKCSEGSQGFLGNRYYIIATNPVVNPPAYWLLPPDKWMSVTADEYRMGH